LTKIPTTYTTVAIVSLYNVHECDCCAHSSLLYSLLTFAAEEAIQDDERCKWGIHFESS